MALGVWPSVFVGSRPFSSRNVNFSPLLFAFRLVICTGYERHVGLFPAPPSPPAFLYSKGARTSPITHTVFTPKSRRSLCSAGLKPTQYSGHSFCRGGATYAFLCGAPVELIRLVFRCSPSLHRDTFRAVHLHGLFNRAEHCLTVSIIPRLTFHCFSFLCYLLSGGLGWPHRGRGGNGLGLASPLDAALLVPTNNKDDFVIYMCVVVAFFVPRIRGKWSAKLRTGKFCSRISQISTSYTTGRTGLNRLD